MKPIRQAQGRLIHFLWDDDTEPAKRFDDAARETNPGAEVVMWRFREVERIMRRELPHMEITYNSMPFLLQRANLLRLVLVEQFGGIYLDMDMECLRPLDGLFERELVFQNANGRVITNAFLGANKPGNMLWHTVLARIAAMDQRVARDTDGVRSSGAELFTQVVKQQGYERHVLPEGEARQYLRHHAGRPAWAGKQFIDGKLHNNRSKYANSRHN